MKLKNFLKTAEMAVGTGIYLLEQQERLAPRMRDRIGSRFNDLRDRAKATYDAASDRLAHASKSLRKHDDHSATWTAAKFAVGLGIGVGVGLLLAPAKGEETRNRLTHKAQEFGGGLRQRLNWQDFSRIGTDG